MNRNCLSGLSILVTCGLISAATADTVHVHSVHITLIEQADVPAREAGVLYEFPVQEGQMVEDGTTLARIEDDAAVLAVERAKLELAIAKQQTENTFDLESAEQANRVAAEDLRRAKEAVERFQRSISAADLDHYQLKAAQTAIEIRRARFDRNLAELNVQVLENALAAELKKLERHRIVAPFGGYVVEMKRHRGEWVQPGETVMRMIRVDRLRAEGFVSASDVRGNLAKAPVELQVNMPDGTKETFAGRLVFVSPEINPVDGQVRVWAEVENRDLRLRPGLKADMTVRRGGSSPREKSQ